MAHHSSKVRKYNAIEKLVKHGFHASEWHEAGLCAVIGEIIDAPDDTIFTSDKILELIKKAKQY